jgi:DNA invertase Pin-like site-specific DNA recombinase
VFDPAKIPAAYQTGERPFSDSLHPAISRPAVPYYRVSTARQGRSGLGLEAQRAAVQDHTRDGWTVLEEHVEVETGTAKRSRPVLARAIERCRLTGATLVIAKLDRLARNVHFVSGLMESGVDFVALDVPQANRFTIHILAAVAEHEAKLISERTRAALAAAKARGRKLGNPEQGARNLRARDGRALGIAAIKANADRRARTLEGVVREFRAGRSLRGLAQAMNDRHIRTARGGCWHAASVARLPRRLGAVGGVVWSV